MCEILVICLCRGCGSVVEVYEEVGLRPSVPCLEVWSLCSDYVRRSEEGRGSRRLVEKYGCC